MPWVGQAASCAGDVTLAMTPCPSPARGCLLPTPAVPMSQARECAAGVMCQVSTLETALLRVYK